MVTSMPSAALAVPRSLVYEPDKGFKTALPRMTDAVSNALYFAFGKTSGSTATRDYSPSLSALLSSQRTLKISRSTLYKYLELATSKDKKTKTVEMTSSEQLSQDWDDAVKQ